MKTLTFDPKYGDIREDGLAVIQKQDTHGWEELAEEIVYAVHAMRLLMAHPIAQEPSRITDEGN